MGAAGVDHQTAADYAEHLEANLQSLLNRAKSGDRYRAPPVRRVHIPKDKPGETPALRDSYVLRTRSSNEPWP